MIAIGKYRARGVNGEFGESKNKGTSFVKVLFRISEGDEAGQEISYDGYFTDKTQARTIESLRYCGCTFPGGDITNLTGIDANEVEIVVEHEEYENKDGEQRTRARIAWVNNPGAYGIGEEQKMNDQKKAAFAAKMKGQILATAKKTGSPNAVNGVSSAKPKTAPNDFVDDLP